MTAMCHLHRGRILITIHGYDFATETHEFNDNFFA
jgi:hypothetical protein